MGGSWGGPGRTLGPSGGVPGGPRGVLGGSPGVLGGSWEGFRGGWGRSWGPRTPPDADFGQIWGRMGVEVGPRSPENLCFPVGFLWIFAESREYMKIHKNLRKTNDFRGLRGPNSTPNRHQNGSQGLLEASWGVLGASWGLLGASGAVLGASWAVLGASWAVQGRILAPLSSEMWGSGGQEARRNGPNAPAGAGRGWRRCGPPGPPGTFLEGNLEGRTF